MPKLMSEEKVNWRIKKKKSFITALHIASSKNFKKKGKKREKMIFTTAQLFIDIIQFP